MPLLLIRGVTEELLEAMMVVVDIVDEAEEEIDKWLGDTGSSYYIKSTRAGMINVEKCPPDTKIRQVQGVVNVQEWGTILLEVDGADGKRIMRLHETLIVPSINVNLFSLQRVLKNGFLPVYDEVEGKCIIKKTIDGGGYSQVATMTVINGRAPLDCRLLNNSDSNSGAALQRTTNKVEKQGKNGAKAWIGPLVGYSVNTPRYRVWDLVSHKVWDVRGPDFDAMVGRLWWKRHAAKKKYVWDDDSQLHLMEGLDLAEELLGEEDPPPPADGDGGGSSSGGEPLSGVNDNEDDSSVTEGVELPRMSAMENRGVPPLRLIEIMAVASETDDGGATASYKEAQKGPEGKGWKKAIDAKEAS